MAIATIKPCISCRDWSDCAGKPWYAPRDIRYCRYQVEWIIKEFLSYQSGDIILVRDKWIPEDRETGYVDTEGAKGSISAHAPFELTVQIIGEVTERLKKTGQDGRLLVLEILNGQQELSREARNALFYCSGWKHKGNYRQWLWNRRYRKNERKTSQSLHSTIDK